MRNPQVANPVNIASKIEKRSRIIEETKKWASGKEGEKSTDSDHQAIEMSSKVKQEPALTQGKRTRSEYESVVFKPYRDWNWHEDDLEVDWTMEDDECLQSIDRLHSRTIEFHNNIHTRHIYRAPGSPDDDYEEEGIYDMQKSMAKMSFLGGMKSMGKMSMSMGFGYSTSHLHSSALSFAMRETTFMDEEAVATVVRFRSMAGPHAWSKYPKKISGREFRNWVKPFENDTGEGNKHNPRNRTHVQSANRSNGVGLQSGNNVTTSLTAAASVDAVKEVRSIAKLFTTESITSAIDGLWGDGCAAAAAEQTIASRETSKQADMKAAKAASGLQSFEKDLAMADLLWVHIDDLQSLQHIAKIYEMHELFLSGFADEREHNTFLVDGLTIFLSVCTCYLDGSNAHMQKVYMFVSFGDGLVITMEKEIMTENPEVDAHNACRQEGFANNASRIVGELLDTKLGDAESDFYYLGCSLGGAFLINQIALHSLAIQDTILDFFSHSTNYFNHVKNLEMKLHNIDKLFITKQLHCTKRVVAMVKAMSALSVDTYTKLFQYVSVGGFSNVSTFSLRDREIMRFGKVSGISDAKQSGKIGLGGMRPGLPKAKKPTREWLNRIKATSEQRNNSFMEETSLYKLFYPSIEESVSFFEYYGRRSGKQLKEEKEADEVRPSLAILTEAQTQVLYFIVEKFKFATSTIQSSQDDVEAVSVQMQQDTDLRAVNTDTLMALISTLFLPASFLTGLFSTNFQPKPAEDYPGSVHSYFYTMLTADWGSPVLLWSTLVVSVLTVVWFTRSGVLDWSINWKRVCSYLTCYVYWGSTNKRDPNKAKYQEAVIQRATGDYVRVRVLARTNSYTSSQASVDKANEDRSLLRNLTQITIAEDEEITRASLKEMGGFDESMGSQGSQGISTGNTTPQSSFGLSNSRKTMKDLFINHVDERLPDYDAYSHSTNPRQNSIDKVGSAPGSNNIVWESQAAKILKRSGLRNSSHDDGDGSSVRSSFNEMMVDHHLVHRFREQQHQAHAHGPKNHEVGLTPQELEDAHVEERFSQAVKSRRTRIMELAALPATSSVEGTLLQAPRGSFDNPNSRFGGAVSSLGRASEIRNPISTQSMHQLGSFTNHRRSITTGRRNKIETHNNDQDRFCEYRESFTGSIISMLHLDFLLGSTAAPPAGNTRDSMSRRNSVTGMHNRHRSNDMSRDLVDSDDDEIIRNLEEDVDNAKENARLKLVEQRRTAIAKGRFNNKKKIRPPLSGTMTPNFRNDVLSKSVDPEEILSRHSNGGERLSSPTRRPSGETTQNPILSAASADGK